MFYMGNFALTNKKEEGYCETTDIKVVGSWRYKSSIDFPWERTGNLLVLELKQGGYFNNQKLHSGYVLFIGNATFNQTVDINEIEKAILREDDDNPYIVELIINTSYGKHMIFSSDPLIDMDAINEVAIDKDTLTITIKDKYGKYEMKKLDNINNAYEMVKKCRKLANNAVIKHKENHKNVMENHGWKNEDYVVALKKSKPCVEHYECWKSDNVLYIFERHPFVLEKEELKSINIDHILFYKVYNQKDTVADVHGGGGRISGGGSNLGGAVLGGVLAGPAGAIIGSRTAVDGTIDSVSTSTRTVDNSFIILKTKTETIELEISSLKALETLIPEKDYDRIEQAKENNEGSNVQVDEIAEIKKYKALLDEGFITEEEFEKKKKQIMKI